VLLARTVREAEERMARLEPDTLLSRRKAQRALALAALFVAPLVVGAALRTDLADTFVRRNIFLSSAGWPRSYELRIVEPASTEQLLAVGDSLTVLALRERGGSARARIEAWFRGADGDETREELPLERRGDDSFRRVFRNVSRDFRFRVHCGDFQSAWYSVQVRNRPRVEEISLTFDYPDYTGLELAGAPRAIEGGHCKVPVGTVVAYRARTSIPVREAVRVESRRVGDGESSTEQPVPVEERTFLAGSFVAEANALYHFRLVSEDGFENPNPIRYRVAVISDLAPSVQILVPGKNLELSPNAELGLRAHIEDDYGIAGAEILFFEEGRGETAEPLHRIPIAALAAGSRTAEPVESILLAPWELAPGMRLEYRIDASDAIGQVGRSRSWLVTIVSEEDLERILREIIPVIRERLQETFEVERDTRRSLEDLVEQSQLSGGTLPEEGRASLRHARLGQERVNSRIEEGIERFLELIEQVRQNRLSDFPELPWVEELHRKLDELSRTDASEALTALDAMTRSGAERTPVPSAQLEGAIEEVRGTERQLQGILDELEEWGDLQTVIRRLEDLLRSERELEEKVESRVRESLGGEDGEDANPKDGGAGGDPDGDD
jgi:hypothetical protein